MAIKTNCFHNIDGLIEMKLEKEEKCSVDTHAQLKPESSLTFSLPMFS